MAVLLTMNPLPLGITIAITLLCGIPYQGMSQISTTSAQTDDRNSLLNNPENAYLKAHYDSQQALKLADGGKYTEAINIIDNGLIILANISKMHKDWKPNLVAFKNNQFQDLRKKWLDQEQQQAKSKVVLPGDKPINKPQAVNQPTVKPNTQYLPPGYQAGSGYMPAVDDRNAIANSHDTVSEIIRNKDIENQALVSALKKTQIKLKQMQEALANASVGQNIYKEELTKYQTLLAKERQTNNDVVKDLSSQISKLETALKQSELGRTQLKEDYDRLLLSFEQNQQLLKTVSEERDALIQERDQLAALVELNSPEKTKNLLDRNLTLAAQLKDAQDKITELETAQANSKEQENVNLQELEKTRTELAEIKLRLISIRDENIGYRKRITELNNKLLNTEIELSKTSQEVENDPVLLEENNLLRNTIAKQLRILSVQEQSRTMLINAYKRQKFSDPEMAKILKLVDDENSIKLTPAEQNLLQTVAKQIVKEAPISDEQQALLLQKEQELTEAKTKADELKLKLEELAKAAEKKDKEAQKKLDAIMKSTEAKAQEVAQLEQQLKEQKDIAQGQANLKAMLEYDGAPNETDDLRQVAEQKMKADIAASLASEAFSQKRYAAAEQLYRTIIQDQPDHVPARINLGTILLQINLVDEAITHLKRATEIDKDSVPAWFMLGVGQYRAGLDKSAMESFLETVKIDPANSKAFEYMGILESCSGNYKKAIQYFDKALDINAQSANALFNLAWAHAHLKDNNKAKKNYDLAIKNGALPDKNLELIMTGQRSVTEPISETPSIAAAAIQAPASAPADTAAVETIPEVTKSDDKVPFADQLPTMTPSVAQAQEAAQETKPNTAVAPEKTDKVDEQPKKVIENNKEPEKKDEPAPRKRRFRIG